MLTDDQVQELLHLLGVSSTTPINDAKHLQLDCLKQVSKYAEDMTETETYQAAEGLIHNLNSLQSRSGNQLPFSSINFGSCTLPEGRLVTRCLLEKCIEGTGKFHRTSIFPCGIFQYKKGINDKPGTPNYDLKRLALKSTAKRLYPNYANCDWSAQRAWVEMDRNLKENVIQTISKEIYDELVTAIKKNPELGEDLFLKVENDKLEVIKEESPIEIFSTMGALAGDEYLYVKIGDSDPVDMKISTLFDISKEAVAHIFADCANTPTPTHLTFKNDPGILKITDLAEDTSVIMASDSILSTMLTQLTKVKDGLSRYSIDLLEYSSDPLSSINKYISSAPRHNVARHYTSEFTSTDPFLYSAERPFVVTDKTVPQELIGLRQLDIMVYDIHDRWVKVNHIFKNSAENTPLMLHIEYRDDVYDCTLDCTEDHPLWTEDGFVQAGQLSVGDTIYTSSGSAAVIQDIKWYAHSQCSYDIGTETGTFIGSDIMMHNCRTANGADVNFDDSYYRNLIDLALKGQKIDHLMLSKAQKDGRGNICPATIIMPTLAMQVDGEVGNKDVDAFLDLLDKKIHETKDELIERFEWICSQDPASAAFMYANNTMAGYVPEEGIKSALEHGTLAIGQLGLAETLQILIGCDHTDPKGMELATKIEKLFNTRCAEFKEEYKLNFGVYYTPAESLCYTAMKKFQEKYGKIPNISDREYFTNSIHVPVWKNMSPFDKIDIESQLVGYSNAGCITYVEIDGSATKNIDALEQIVDYAMDKDIPYFAVNVPSDTCLDCGAQGEFNSNCTECNSTNIEQLRRVTGYLSTDYRHFNLGKQDEVEDRVHHVNQFTTLEGDNIE